MTDETLETVLENSLFGQLLAGASDDWHCYIDHDFVRQLGQGTLPTESFRHYLVQDYLFLRHFVRAYALVGFKSDNLADMRAAAATMNGLLDHEMPLHLEYCRQWGLSEAQIEAQHEAQATVAYTRFVIDTGLAGDVLDLQVALSPCVIGYGIIANRIRSEEKLISGGNPYQPWIDTYAGSAYQYIAIQAVRQLDVLSSRRGGVNRIKELLKIFSIACRLESQFWDMGLNISA
jgi:thiaminase/transcriptional activator TenA